MIMQQQYSSIMQLCLCGLRAWKCMPSMSMECVCFVLFMRKSRHEAQSYVSMISASAKIV